MSISSHVPEGASVPSFLPSFPDLTAPKTTTNKLYRHSPQINSNPRNKRGRAKKKESKHSKLHTQLLIKLNLPLHISPLCAAGPTTTTTTLYTLTLRVRRAHKSSTTAAPPLKKKGAKPQRNHNTTQHFLYERAHPPQKPKNKTLKYLHSNNNSRRNQALLPPRFSPTLS